MRRCWLGKSGTCVNFGKKVVGQGQRVLGFADERNIVAKRTYCVVETNDWFAIGQGGSGAPEVWQGQSFVQKEVVGGGGWRDVVGW